MKNHWKDKQKKGFLFWITGLSGSGKTSIAKKIKKEIEDHFGPTILISGDDVRNIFNLKGYSYKQRYETVIKYCKLSCFLTNQNINVIFESFAGPEMFPKDYVATKGCQSVHNGIFIAE